MKPFDPFEDFPIDVDEPVFTSGVVSRLLGIPVWILKQLDRENIVSPPRKRKNCSRLYSKKELGKLHHVWFYLKEKRVKMEGLKVILEIEARLDRTKGKKP